MQAEPNRLRRDIAVTVMAVFAAAGLAGATAAAEPPAAATWPGEYSVERDDGAGRLSLSTPFYSVRHDLRRGGAIASVRLVHGKAENLLVRPIAVRVVDEGGAVLTDLADGSPRVSRREEGSREVVRVEARLLGDGGLDRGAAVTTTYEYRWGTIKVRREISLAPGTRIRELCPVSAVLAPSLADYGYREGTTEAEGAPPFSFGSCRWGKTGAGKAGEPALRIPFVPRYVVLADPGVEGLEWFAGSDLAPWELGPAGRRGRGLGLVAPSADPAGVTLTIAPLHLAEGAIAVEKPLVLECHLGVPVIDGRAAKPWLHASFNRNRGEWVSPEAIRGWAASGIATVHCHNDGDYYDDGLFWRDGSYPPYPDMEKFDAVLEGCRKAGIRTATYFSNKELHPSTKEFGEHGKEWARKDAKGNIQHNAFKAGSEFGAQMCLRSGWLGFLKLSIDRVLRNHRLDGVYYDWNVALLCMDPVHEGRAPGEAASGHWDIDELLDLMEWTRRRVGPEGLVIVHDTTTPMLATENLADHVVANEWGYGKWSEGVRLDGLPLEWTFVGARSRGVISYGQIDGGAPRRAHRQFALAALLGGVTPWPASPEAHELIRLLAPLGDFEAYRFLDWRNGAVTLDGSGRAGAAIYGRPGEAWILLANLEADAREIGVILRPARLPHPLPALAEAAVMAISPGSGAGTGSPEAPAALDARKLTAGGEKIRLPGDGLVIIRVR